MIAKEKTKDFIRIVKVSIALFLSAWLLWKMVFHSVGIDRVISFLGLSCRIQNSDDFLTVDYSYSLLTALAICLLSKNGYIFITARKNRYFIPMSLILFFTAFNISLTHYAISTGNVSIILETVVPWLGPMLF